MLLKPHRKLTAWFTASMDVLDDSGHACTDIDFANLIFKMLTAAKKKK